MKTRDVLLGAVILCGLVLATKAAQVSLTPEFWAWLSVAGKALVQSSAVKFLVIATVLLWGLSMVALAWERMEREHERRTTERAARREAERLERAGHVRSLRVREEIDEAIRNRHDRGPRAA